MICSCAWSCRTSAAPHRRRGRAGHHARGRRGARTRWSGSPRWSPRSCARLATGNRSPGVGPHHRRSDPPRRPLQRAGHRPADARDRLGGGKPREILPAGRAGRDRRYPAQLQRRRQRRGVLDPRRRGRGLAGGRDPAGRAAPPRVSDEEAAALALRPGTPEDARGIVRLTFRCYGYTYVDGTLYAPGRHRRAHPQRHDGVPGGSRPGRQHRRASGHHVRSQPAGARVRQVDGGRATGGANSPSCSGGARWPTPAHAACQVCGRSASPTIRRPSGPSSPPAASRWACCWAARRPPSRWRLQQHLDGRMSLVPLYIPWRSTRRRPRLPPRAPDGGLSRTR